MTIGQLDKIHSTRPFQPFEIPLADGRTLRLDHAAFLARTPQGRTIAVGLPDGTIEIVDLLLVVSLKPVSNGKQPPRAKKR